MIECGGRKFEIISTPGGETLDSLSVWMPAERVVFTGNLFGPMFMGMPFLNTLRGDKPRSVGRFLRSLETVRDLRAETLITGHGEPIRGAARIHADLDKLHAAVSYVDKATKAGMNAGKDLYTLMREVRLPPDLQIGEWHGNVPWAVKSIWHEYSGWFLYESTTELYGVPRSSVDNDLAELSGGSEQLAQRASAHVAAGRPLQALHLLDIALGAEPQSHAALRVKQDALELLLEESGGNNLSEMMWLKSELADVEDRRLREAEERIQSAK
jgi:alkyl sulfatase BDS1-like metallo-beta-lactamase superfamily hydrolase